MDDRDNTAAAPGDTPEPLDTRPNHSHESISTILDSLDALVYVADMNTHEILFLNAYGRAIWGDGRGKTCWQVFQSEQSSACSFCTNERLLDSHGRPTDVYVWEFQNTVNQRWYQCRDQAIRWIDGRLVRMEIATDITERKLAEEELKAAKEQAEVLARTDELTGINNRRAFMQGGQQQLNQTIRYQHPLSLIMLDIDHFKSINDKYGHTAGDTVLQTVAKLLKAHSRVVDNIGRLGGEEFAMILPETPIENAIALAERLQSQLALTRIDNPQGEIAVTASFGISTYDQDASSLENLLSKADLALYRAKKNGRNRIEIAN